MLKIKEFINKGVTKIGIKTVKRKNPFLKNLIDNPEDFKLEAFIEGEELIFKVKKKEEL